jgi:transketolase
VRVVSMVCQELFLIQDEEYRNQVLPQDVKRRLIIEAALPACWDELSGSAGLVVGIDRFGASAPGDVVLEKLGISTDNLVKKARIMLENQF